MENLMAQVIQQMKTTDSGDLEKGTPSRRHTFESSSALKSTETDSRSSRTSSFSILRSNVLQYVENGEWSAEPLKTTTRVPGSSHEKKSSRKSIGPCKPEVDVTSHEPNSAVALSAKPSDHPTDATEEHGAPSTSKPHSEYLNLLAFARWPDFIQHAGPNRSKCEDEGGTSCNEAERSDGYKKCLDYNFPLQSIYRTEGTNYVLTSLESSTESESSSCEAIFGSTGQLSPSSEDPRTEENLVGSSDTTSKNHMISFDSVDKRMEKVSNADTDSSDAEDGSILNSDDANICNSEGLSTYTLHSRWQEVLPKEVIHRISRDNDSSKTHLFHNLKEISIFTDTEQPFIDSELSGSADEIANGNAYAFIVSDKIVENSAELCWSTVFEGSVDIETSGQNETNDDVEKTSCSLSNSDNSSKATYETSRKSSSIQDAYRSILKIISNGGDGTALSLQVGKRARSMRKAKRKTKHRPVYTCSKCQASYVVSSKKAIAISRCLKCDLWTSVNTVEEDGDEVPVSFCCLA